MRNMGQQQEYRPRTGRRQYKHLHPRTRTLKTSTGQVTSSHSGTLREVCWQGQVTRRHPLTWRS
ncbi:hypothetical protein LINPERPRIM_LOCUS35938 [Linum perenne]